MKTNILEVLFVLVLLIIFAIYKSIPFGIWETIGYGFVGIIHGLFLGAIIWLLVSLILGFLIGKGEKKANVAKNLSLIICFFIDAYVIAWVLIKLTVTSNPISWHLHYPYYWIAPLTSNLIHIILFKFIDKD